MKKRRVLVVDDSQLARILTKRALGGDDFVVVGEAGNGNEAIRLFRELHPDLVISDIIMPEMDGLELLKAILAIDPQANVVLLSSVGQSITAQQALEAGAVAVVAKPFKPQALRATVDALSLENGAS